MLRCMNDILLHHVQPRLTKGLVVAREHNLNTILPNIGMEIENVFGRCAQPLSNVQVVCNAGRNTYNSESLCALLISLTLNISHSTHNYLHGRVGLGKQMESIDKEKTNFLESFSNFPSTS